MANNQDYSVERIKEIYSHLTRNIDFSPQSPVPITNAIYRTLLSEVAEYNDGGEWFTKMCNESASLAEVSSTYHNSVEYGRCSEQ